MAKKVEQGVYQFIESTYNILFIFKEDVLSIKTKKQENIFFLGLNCSGGGSIYGDYIKGDYIKFDKSLINPSQISNEIYMNIHIFKEDIFSVKPKKNKENTILEVSKLYKKTITFSSQNIEGE